MILRLPIISSPRLRGLLLLVAIALTSTLAACGTKGSLECPPGTQERIDGTCKPPPA